MSEIQALRFLIAASGDRVLMDRYNRRDLTQLVFHAKHDGFDFTAEELAAVVGPLEIGVILEKDGESVDEASSLWRRMWGRPHLEYVAEAVISRFTRAELESSQAVVAEEAR
ncbi:Nif11 family protein [Actinospica robiniae]|uniref:Nif11 family protein n=1 Tax=Actinospica robiniae TaxID=304901 RepID=UPI000403ABED|nr:Nif11 family protein [Actinospica robiniae]